MFASFFPDPKRFFLSAVLWTILSMALWYLWARDLGEALSLGWLIGKGYPSALAEGADAAAQGANKLALTAAIDVWLYQYMIVSGALFGLLWWRLSPHRWFRWSVLVSMVIIFATWFQVQLDVMINEWFGTFYDLIQTALGTPNSVTETQIYLAIASFLKIALVYVFVATLFRFFVSHFVFRWRTAMNNYYMSRWQEVRHIEGASQRVQEDTMRFAQIAEGLGVNLLDSVMTLIAFLPLLWGLSASVKALPIIGEVSQGLVFVAILWSVFGTALVALAGIRLPGLEFRNQRVEAAYRKELVYGEDHEDRAAPPTVAELFSNVRKNYFRLYFNYLYFNVVRIFYLQIGNLVPYIALAPTIASGVITLGVMQQIIRAFSRVEGSFQYLINSWTTIVELMSVYKRLQAFEAAFANEELPDIDKEWITRHENPAE